MSSDQPNSSSASGTTAPTGQENNGFTTNHVGVDGDNRQTEDNTRPQVATAPTDSLQVTEPSETQDVNLERLSQYPTVDRNTSRSNS